MPQPAPSTIGNSVMWRERYYKKLEEIKEKEEEELKAVEKLPEEERDTGFIQILDTRTRMIDTNYTYHGDTPRRGEGPGRVSGSCVCVSKCVVSI